jgi:hypothetical protein
MTREQVRSVFEDLRQDPEIAKGVTLDDSDPEFLYFLAGACPRLRYRFKDDHLVAAGRLGTEGGSWTYIGRDFTEPRCDVSRTRSGEYHWFRSSPIYDERGVFVGTEQIDDGPLSEASLRAYLHPMERIDATSRAQLNYCEGMMR